MRPVYFVIDSDGYIDGGISYSPLEDAIKLELPKDHEIFKTDSTIFKYVDGELVKDEEKQQKLIEENEKKSSKPSAEDMNALAILELAEKFETLKERK